MKFWMLVLLLSVSFLSPVHAKRKKAVDVRLNGIPLKQAIESVARLNEKHVIYLEKLPETNVDVFYNQVTPEEALKYLMREHNLHSQIKGETLLITTQAPKKSVRTPAADISGIFKLRNVIASDVEENVRAFIGDKGKVSVNAGMNALIVSIGQREMPRVAKMIFELDAAIPQVRIEAKVIETSTNFSRELGIQWGTPVSPRGSGPSINAPANDSLFRWGVSAGITNPDLEAIITAGEKNGNLKIISSPNITTLNGKVANIESNITYSIRTLSALPNATAGAGTNVAGGIQSISAGLKLKVTPFIMNNGSVRLEIVLSKSDPDFSQSVDGIPGISANSASTSLVVMTGQTASIGGLIHKSTNDSKRGAPFLSKIPILGLLFGSSTTEETDREVLIFLTPTVVGYELKPEMPGTGRAKLPMIHHDMELPKPPAVTPATAPEKGPSAPPAASAPASPSPASVVPAPPTSRPIPLKTPLTN